MSFMCCTILAVYRNASLKHWPAFNTVHVLVPAQDCVTGDVLYFLLLCVSSQSESSQSFTVL
jgi:hypothetical protein